MINNKIKLLFKKWLCKVVAFYTDQPYELVLNEHHQFALKPSSDTQSTKWLLVVGRQHYNEQLNAYPIGNKKELKQLLEIEKKSKDKQQATTQTLVTVMAAEQSQVMQWQFAKDLPKAWFTLPESLLMSQTVNDGEVILNTHHNASFITKHQKNVCSSLQSKIINSPERFASMFGIPLSKVININTEQEYLERVINGLYAVPKQYLQAFLNIPVNIFNKRLALRYSAIFGGIFVVYGLLTSGYLVFKTHQLESQLDANKATVNKALNTLNVYMTSRDALQQRQQLLRQLPITSPVFMVISDLFNSAELSSISWQEGRFVLRGKANKATDALATVMQDSRVEDAKFDYPSRKERGGESFVISFVLNTGNDQVIPAVSEQGAQ
ncbi:hypothetical protein HYD28_00305 [Pseudoalteromonas shioyasakiensis]|nr:hypothetical protein HYD28_00305 [Pseudoalteromonas shioyasakiensis]